MNLSPGVLVESVTFRPQGRTLPSDRTAPSVRERLHAPAGPRGPCSSGETEKPSGIPRGGEEPSPLGRAGKEQP
jgi:hypothetical protein